MPLRLKKLIGTVLLVALIAIYAIFAIIIAVGWLGAYGGVVHFAYFLFTGLLWVLPAMLIVKWMAGPVEKKDG